MQLQKLVFTLYLVATVATKTANDECPFWKEIIQFPPFKDYVVEFAKMGRLDIAVPPEFGMDESLHLTRFLKKAPVSSRILSTSQKLCASWKCKAVENDRYVVLIPVCKSTQWRLKYDLFSTHYVIYVYVVCTDLKIPTDVDWNSIVNPLDKLRFNQGSGVFVFFRRNQKIWLTENHKVKCLNCRRNLDPRELFKDEPLRNSKITVLCRHPNFCESHKIGSLEKVIVQRNASFKAVPIFNYGEKKNVFLSLKVLRDPTMLLYTPSFVDRLPMFPNLYAPCSYESIGFVYFVKDRVPLPREMVLLLPFTGGVWLALFGSLTLCVLVSFVITSNSLRKVANVHSLIALFAASLLQQSYHLNAHNVHNQPLRIILGIWSLAVTVLATGFKGALISLLWNVPLDGPVIKFTTERGPASWGFNICFLTSPEDIAEKPQIERGIRVRPAAECLDPSGKINIRPQGKDTFMFLDGALNSTDVFKRQLMTRGYIEQESFLPNFITGPMIRCTSPYRKAVGKLLIQAFEAGFFERYKLKAEFNQSVKWQQISRREIGEEPMTLTDIRPCFFLLGTGIAFSSVVFLLSWIVYNTVTKRSATKQCTTPHA